MAAPFLMYLLQEVQVLINVRMRGTTVDFQIVPQLAVDFTISLTPGQEVFQSLGDKATLQSENNGRVDRGWVRILFALTKESHPLGWFIESP